MSALLLMMVFFGVWVGVWLPLAVPIAQKVQWQPFQPLTPSQKLPLLGSLYLLVPLLIGAMARWRGETWASYGLSGQPIFWKSATLGFVLGGVGLALLYGLQIACGWLRWSVPGEVSKQLQHDRWKWLELFGLPLVLGVWVGITEELLFRGFLLYQLQADFSPFGAAVILSALFAVLHLVWERQETLPQLPGLVVMSGVLVLARWCDDNLIGLAWGLHAGWVWLIATLDNLGAIAVTPQAWLWLTGRNGHPLSGLLGITFLGLTALIVLVWPQFRSILA